MLVGAEAVYLAEIEFVGKSLIKRLLSPPCCMFSICPDG
jgi:hypothetical protein